MSLYLNQASLASEKYIVLSNCRSSNVVTRSSCFLIISRFFLDLLFYFYCLPFAYSTKDQPYAIAFTGIMCTGTVLSHMITAWANIIICIHLPRNTEFVCRQNNLCFLDTTLTSRVLTSYALPFRKKKIKSRNPMVSIMWRLKLWTLLSDRLDSGPWSIAY